MNINLQLYQALCDADLSLAETLLLKGADVNWRNEYGESLIDAVTDPTYSDPKKIHRVVKFMLENGADPSPQFNNGSGPIFHAVIQADTELLRLLLDHGVDPNLAHDEGEPLFDWEMFDYCYSRGFPERDLPEEPTEADRSSTDAWLKFLDQLAIKYGRPRPQCLLILREYGALSHQDRKERGLKTWLKEP